MAIQHAYAVTNKLAGLLTSIFTWSNSATDNLARLNDGRMDKKFSVGAATSTVNLVIDFGAATAIEAIAILNHNLATATSPTIKVEAADDSAITTNAVTAKAATSINQDAPRHKDTVLQFAAVSRRYWRITFAWVGSFNLQIGELFPCLTTALSRAIVYGNVSGEEYITSRFGAYAGETRGHYIAGPIRTRQLPFEDLDADERDELLALFRATFGGATPLLWIEQYEATSTAADDDHQEVILGRLDEMALTNVEFDFGRYNPSGLTLRSLGREVGA